MNKHFFVSDTHFSHRRCIEFRDLNDQLIRPFESVEEMDEHMVKSWNSVVSQDDVVYHLGDVCFQVAKSLPILNRLNGKKILILGNHDHASKDKYMQYFDKVEGSYTYDTWLLTHYPVHHSVLSEERYTHNIHGHIHEREIFDYRYLNVGVERINYTPVTKEQVEQMFRDKKQSILLEKGKNEAYA